MVGPAGDHDGVTASVTASAIVANTNGAGGCEDAAGTPGQGVVTVPVTPPADRAGMDNSAQVEYAALGALMLGPRQLAELRPWLAAEDFSLPVCRVVYGRLLQMADAGRPIDPVTVRAEMGSRGELRSDGYPGLELFRMTEAAAVPVTAGYYARLVMEAAVFRLLEEVGQRVNQVGGARRGDADDAFHFVARQWAVLADSRRRWRGATDPITGPARLARRPPYLDLSRPDLPAAASWAERAAGLAR